MRACAVQGELYMVRILLLSLGLLIAPFVKAAIEITDLAGRQVQLEKPAERFVISEGRYVLTLSLLRPEHPVQGLVGMMQPVSWTDPVLQQQLYELFPEARNIALFGHKERSSVSVEKIIDLKPELAIFGVQDHGPGTRNAELLQQLEKAGIKIVYIDFRLNPLANTVPSIKVLGQVLGAEQRAETLIEFYQQRRAAVSEAIAGANTRPRVFLQAHAGRFECCVAMADGMLGPFVKAAGGINIADAVAPGPTAKHTMEYLLVENPDVFIATASGTAEDLQTGKPWVALGPGVSEQQARKSLQDYVEGDAFQALDAVSKHRTYAIWHEFYNSPFNIVVLEAFAKWLHPERLPQLDPEQTQKILYEKFTPFRWQGTATVSLSGSGDR